jgi:hypothetical protein
VSVRRWLVRHLIDFLTRPLASYERRGWDDLPALRRTLRKGDVLLVEGDQRISAVIRYLTQSSWSHAALYVGDELLQRDEHLRREVVACFGDDARHMLIEALLDGVVASPLSKYVELNLRICRPRHLKIKDLRRILDDAVRSLGWQYDLRNIVDLMRYLLPVSIVPARFRRTALHFGSGVPTEVICSSHLGRLFQAVGFPIAPIVELPQGFDAAGAREPRLLRLVFGHESAEYTGLFRQRHPSLLTPRDFDLSPYFEVVKCQGPPGLRLDYSRIRWAREDPPAAPVRRERG